MESFTGDAIALTTFLLGFGAIAVFVAGLVIANTFSVLLAQRTRELALLRVVGATAGQVRRGVMTEAAITGLAASLLGVGLGVGLAGLVSTIVGGVESPIPLGGLHPVVRRTPRACARNVGHRAGRAGPVQGRDPSLPVGCPTPHGHRTAALTPRTPPAGHRAGMLGVGLTITLLGVTAGEVLITLAGEMLSALGALLLLQRVIPPVVARC